jgi:hypothetical protein
MNMKFYIVSSQKIYVETFSVHGDMVTPVIVPVGDLSTQ